MESIQHGQSDGAIREGWWVGLNGPRQRLSKGPAAYDWEGIGRLDSPTKSTSPMCIGGLWRYAVTIPR
jgi:hypothetical protein